MWFVGLRLYKDSNGTSKRQGKKKPYKLQPIKLMLSSQEQQHLIFHQSITPFQKFLKGANLLFLDSVMLLYHQSVNNHRVLFCFSAPPQTFHYNTFPVNYPTQELLNLLKK